MVSEPALCIRCSQPVDAHGELDHEPFVAPPRPAYEIPSLSGCLLPIAFCVLGLVALLGGES